MPSLKTIKAVPVQVSRLWLTSMSCTDFYFLFFLIFNFFCCCFFAPWCYVAWVHLHWCKGILDYLNFYEKCWHQNLTLVPTLLPSPQTAFYLHPSKRELLEEAIQVMYMINSSLAYNGMRREYESVISSG